VKTDVDKEGFCYFSSSLYFPTSAAAGLSIRDIDSGNSHCRTPAAFVAQTIAPHFFIVNQRIPEVAF
jgi:hypothetical protein